MATDVPLHPDHFPRVPGRLGSKVGSGLPMFGSAHDHMGLRLPHCEQTSPSRQLRTRVSEQYRVAISAGPA